MGARCKWFGRREMRRDALGEVGGVEGNPEARLRSLGGVVGARDGDAAMEVGVVRRARALVEGAAADDEAAVAEPARVVGRADLVGAARLGDEHGAEGSDVFDVEHHVEPPCALRGLGDDVVLDGRARVARHSELVEGGEGLVAHRTQEEAIGEEAHARSDLALSRRAEDAADVGVQEWLSAHDLEHVGAERAPEAGAGGAHRLDGERAVRKVRGDVAALRAAKVAVLDHVELDGLHRDAPVLADGVAAVDLWPPRLETSGHPHRGLAADALHGGSARQSAPEPARRELRIGRAFDVDLCGVLDAVAEVAPEARDVLSRGEDAHPRKHLLDVVPRDLDFEGTRRQEPQPPAHRAERTGSPSARHPTGSPPPVATFREPIRRRYRPCSAMGSTGDRRKWGAFALLVLAALIALRVAAGGPIGADRGRTQPAEPSRAADAGLLSALATVDAPPPHLGTSDEAGAEADWTLRRDSPPITIAGRALVDGRAAAGTTVVLTNATSLAGNTDTRVARLETDVAGRFAFRDVPRLRGAYRVEAYASHAAPAAVSVPGDVDRRDVELLLEACKLHIYGSVRDASGGPVAGARVSIEMLPEHAVTTDASGAFRLCTGPRPGRLVVSARGYGTWFGRVVPRGALRQDVTLSPKASLAGNVTMASTGAAVPFARLAIRDGGDLVAAAVADASGAFRVDDVAPGAYRLEARGARGSTKAPIEVAVFAGSETDVAVALDERALVRGRVVASGEPVADVAVTIGYGATQEWSSEAHTDAEGAFTIADAPIGERLAIKVADVEVLQPRSITVRGDAPNDWVVEVARRAELVASVTRGGTPVRNAIVTARGPSRPTSAWTGPDGLATFRGLAAGSYRLIAELDGGFATKDGVVVGAAGRATAALELGAEASVVGRVVDTRGAPVDGARVDLTLTSSTEDGAAWAVTGNDGSFRGGPLRSNAMYRPTVTRSRARLTLVGTPTVTVSRDGVVSPSALTLVVEPSDLILRGAVLDEAGGPVPDARVIVTSAERHAPAIAMTSTGNDGTFEVHGLAAGPFTVKVAASSGATIEKTPIMLSGDRLVITMPAAGTLRGTLRGFRRAPQVMAWGAAGYDWDFHPAVLRGDTFEVRGLAPGKYYVAAGATDAAATVPFEIAPGGTATVELVASDKRTVRGVARDFVTGRGLSGVSCQAAPYIEGARSPVVIPGAAAGDATGAFTFADVPASDLYTWCAGEWHVRGGATRIPAAAGEAPITVWMVDPAGVSLDTDALGLGFDDDHPFSRRIVRVEPKGLGARAGVLPGDIVERISDRAMNEGGNGLARTFLAFVLAREKRAAIVVARGAAAVPLTMAVD